MSKAGNGYHYRRAILPARRDVRIPMGRHPAEQHLPKHDNRLVATDRHDFCFLAKMITIKSIFVR